MITTFGWKAAVAVVVNATGAALLFRKELANLPLAPSKNGGAPVPAALKYVFRIPLHFFCRSVRYAHVPRFRRAPSLCPAIARSLRARSARYG